MTNEVESAGLLLPDFGFAIFCLVVTVLGFGLVQQFVGELIAALSHQSHQRRQGDKRRDCQERNFPSLEVHPRMLPRARDERPGESQWAVSMRSFRRRLSSRE